MNIGKQKRMKRIVNMQTSRLIIIPLDHGMTLGAIKGIENVEKTITDMVEGNANALLMHKGLVQSFNECTQHSDTPLILHLSASSSLAAHANHKALVSTVEEAIIYGADAVSIHINIGSESEAQMLADAGKVAKKCNKWGMPLLMMVYGRGPKINDPYSAEIVGHCARIGAELGADIVKINYTGSIESFSKVIEGCPVPVVIAGGDCLDTDKDILIMAHDALQAGAKGLSIGRNIFQHDNRVALMHALNAIVHKNASVDAAMQYLNNRH